MMYSKWERCKCPYGRIFYIRWKWSDDSSIENSDIEGSCYCKLCEQDRRCD